jgi:hypothetical protein
LSPDRVQELRAKAPEFLQIVIFTVTMGEKHGERQEVTYTAKVVGVERSAANLKSGDEIRIRGYIRNPDDTNPPMPQPKFPKLLNKGWTGDAYLSPVAESKDLTPRVFGHSFVEKKRESDDQANSTKTERDENARQVAQAWFSAWMTGQTAVATSLSAVPVSLDGKRNIETIEEVRKVYDAFVKRNADVIERNRKNGIKIKSIQVAASSTESVVVKITIPDDDEGGKDDETIEVTVKPGHAFHVVGFVD